MVGLAVAAVLLYFTKERTRPKRLDERISFRQRDKIPYGTFVAYQGLQSMYPKATVKPTQDPPGYWDSLSQEKKGQALVIITPVFDASIAEMKELLRFTEEGNDVFVSAMNISDAATNMMRCATNINGYPMYFPGFGSGDDSLIVSLNRPPFDNRRYAYPGGRLDNYFSEIDSATCTVLGFDKNNRPNFIHLKAGIGNFYVHLAPMAFTNYFLMHKDNITYLENVLSVIPAGTRYIAWDEYFIRKRPKRPDARPNWFSGFLKEESLRWALLTALIALLVYVLLEMRRKQRIIPVIKKPANDSLDFVKTIGRLYHDKGDHRNLSRKMSAYFLEHVRNRYKLPTSVLDETFEQHLHFKTGVAKEEIHGIVSFIQQLEHASVISEKQLAWFHKQLESFYARA
jgi:hypothetical protein